MIVADTDVLIDALRGRGAAERVHLELSTGRLATTSITVFELLSGARSPDERARIEVLLAAMVYVPLDADAAREAAIIRRELASTPIGTADTLIAGICRSRRAMLMTRNRAHFSRVRDLYLATLDDD